ncbi:MAG TPA: hypothetical protein VJI15_06530 [Candidatus Nanoarchaeia archaeon]|nr:hypothetical protein [Candidatus Nanoarchaeia archaeon]
MRQLSLYAVGLLAAAACGEPDFRRAPCSTDYCAVASTLEFQGWDQHQLGNIQYDLGLMGFTAAKKQSARVLFEVQGKELAASEPPSSSRSFVPTGECSDLLQGDQLMVTEVQVSGKAGAHTADYCLIPGLPPLP